jgi:MYXO-CTERM domain-containing protein
VRRLLLAELGRYRRWGQFPCNPLFQELTPFFIDAQGTRCAVAHLLELGGEGELVQRIARERNNARVAELGDEPRLRAWLDAAGLTLDEAALIQPSYCEKPDTGCVCRNTATGQLEVSTTSAPKDGIATARVNVIHGRVDPSIEVGSEIQVESFRSEPAELIVPGWPTGSLDDGTPTFSGADVTNDRFFCGGDVVISKQQYLQAVQSSNCDGTMRSFDEWEVPDCNRGCGCRAVGASAPTPAGILIALVGAIVARRMARRG